MNRAGPASWLTALLLAAAGCQDLREYAGEWTGELSSDPALGHGFAPGTTITAEVASATRDGISLIANWEGKAAPFVPIRRASGDVLSEVQLPGEPLRTFFGFVQPPGEAPYLSRPFPKYARRYSDYDHLARVKEWSLVSGEGLE